MDPVASTSARSLAMPLGMRLQPHTDPRATGLGTVEDGQQRVVHATQAAMTLHSGNGTDRLGFAAQTHEIVVGPDGQWSIDGPRLRSQLDTTVGRAGVSLGAGLDVGRISDARSMAVRAVQSLLPSLRVTSDPAGDQAGEMGGDFGGVRTYRLDLPMLDVTVRGVPRVGALDAVANASEVAQEIAGHVANTAVDAAIAAKDGLIELWDRGEEVVARLHGGDSAKVVPPPSDRSPQFLTDLRLTAAASAAAYNGSDVPGMSRVDTELLRGRLDGFAVSAFHGVPDGQRTLVIAFRGSEAEAGDWLTNLAHLIVLPTQYIKAAMVVGAAKEQAPDARIVVTGHSLGGGLAAFAGRMNGVPAYAYNAAGPQLPTTMALAAMGRGPTRGQVVHINDPADPLTGTFARTAGRTWGDRLCAVTEGPGLDPRAESAIERIRTGTFSFGEWMANHAIDRLAQRIDSVGGVGTGVRVECTTLG